MATLYAQPATNARTAYNAESAGGLVTAVAEFDIAVDNAGTAIATSDVVQMLKLPKQHVIVDVVLDTDAIAAGTVGVGLVSGTGVELIPSGTSVGTAAAIRASVAGFTRIAPSTSEEVIAVTFSAGSAATTGKFRLTLQYRASDFGL